MATNFNENSIVSSGGFKPSSKDTPLDIRTRVETEQDIYEIPNPYIGMIVYVKDTGKRFEILTLKEVDTRLTTKNVVDTYKQFTVDLEEYAKIEDVPTKVSELENDKGYLVNQDISGKADVDDIPTKVSELENDRGYATERFVDSKIETINNTINSNTNTINSKINTINSEIDGIDSNIVNLNTEIDNINTDLIGVLESIEGSWISVDSKDGYLKDVEILGNTVQDADNLADIRSVGDKVEGQELYEIPVLIRGKNLIKNIELGSLSSTSNGSMVANNSAFRTDFIRVEGGKKYSLSIYTDDITFSGAYLYDKNYSYISHGSLAEPLDDNCRYIKIIGRHKTSGTDLTNMIKDIKIQLEEGTVKTPYEPYQEDKLTILSPVQLEKVGDIADRIICKDGVWGVEKNIITKAISDNNQINNTNNGTLDNDETMLFTISTDESWEWIKSNPYTRPTISSKFLVKAYNEVVPSNNIIEGLTYEASFATFYVRILKENLKSPDVKGVMEYLIGTTLSYKRANPQFIPLPYNQQVKLRTFANKTNISFLTEIEGTLKASVPKSIGATVSSHSEQIDNLGKELDRVKKLEESTASTVTTESDFTTVTETSNGYFEDVKLEGKTLVNLYPKLDVKNYSSYNVTFKDDTITIDANGNFRNLFLKKDVLQLKTSTYYTFVINIIENTIEGENPVISFGDTLSSQSSKFSGAHVLYLKDKKGICTFKLKTKDSFDNINLDIRDYLVNTATSGTIVFKYMILEGDHTQNPPEFFEGLKSVGDGVDEISVLSANENLFDGELELGSIDTFGNISSEAKSIRSTNYIPVKQNTNYSISNSLNYQSNLFAYDKDYKFISFICGIDGSGTFTTPLNCEYIRFRTQSSTSQNDLNCKFMLNVGTIPKPYQPTKQDKKRILYYNDETQTWEKPVLREWDSIEKHSDGKYYYHVRSGEVVLDGSKAWSLDRNNGNGYSIYYTASIKGKNKGICLSDSFKYLQAGYSNLAEECIKFNEAGRLCILINNAKLSEQNAKGFVAWLQANPTTIVYQPAEEKVYECTNLDLITYADETNFLVKSGVLNPKVTLKIHQNITNIITILQNKVSVLENVFIQGLKQVLAGDMQSLAYMLYPEDFENIEQSIDETSLGEQQDDPTDE